MKSNIQLYECSLPSHNFIAKVASFISSNRCGKKQADFKHMPFKSEQKQQTSSLVQLEKNYFYCNVIISLFRVWKLFIKTNSNFTCLITAAYLPFGSFPPSNISAHTWWVPAIAIHKTLSSWVPETFKNGCIKTDEKKISSGMCSKTKKSINQPCRPPYTSSPCDTGGKKKNHNHREKGGERENVSHLPRSLLFFFCTLPRDIKIVF